MVQDHFGGDIRKPPTAEGDHFLTDIDGARHDRSVSQFKNVPTYLDIPVAREEVFADTDDEQYAALTRRFLTAAAHE